MRVPESGGAAQAVAFLDTTAAEAEAWLPEILPDGKTVLISVSGGVVSWHIDAIKPDGSRVMLVENALLARYAPGYLVYQDLSSQAVLCAPFDADRLAFTGPAVPLTDPVDANHAFDIDTHGTLVYVPVMGANAGSEVVWLDRNGAASLVTETRGTWASPRVSSDGKRVLLRKTLVNCELWMYDVESGALGRIVQGPDSHDPIWGPDGRRIVYSQANAGGKTVTQTVDGTREVRDVPVGDPRARAQSWSGGNNVLAYTAPGRGTRSDIWTLAMDGAAKPALFLATPFEETVPDISPDGRFIAYVSDESGAAEVFVRPYPSAVRPGRFPSAAVPARSGPATGRELFFVSGTRMMAVAVDAAAGFRTGKAVELFSGGFNTARARDFDVAPDGRFVAIRVPGGRSGATGDSRGPQLAAGIETRRRVGELICNSQPAPTRSLRNPRAARRGRDGRGVPRARHAARPRRRDQGAAAAPDREPRGARALRARGEDRLVAQPPAHLHALRRRPRGRHRLPGDGAGRGRDAGARGSRRARCRRRKCCGSARRSPTRSTARTARASCTAT